MDTNPYEPPQPSAELGRRRRINWQGQLLFVSLFFLFYLLSLSIPVGAVYQGNQKIATPRIYWAYYLVLDPKSRVEGSVIIGIHLAGSIVVSTLFYQLLRRKAIPDINE